MARVRKHIELTSPGSSMQRLILKTGWSVTARSPWLRQLPPIQMEPKVLPLTSTILSLAVLCLSPPILICWDSPSYISILAGDASLGLLLRREIRHKDIDISHYYRETVPCGSRRTLTAPVWLANSKGRTWFLS
ncbi:hypothetical protein HPP92_003047 [Vanilla planifolia]|uniref:Uncharacterized protein n=1 Tax=Vanilla planifolia TaxID=51239 RepID=A0A835VJ18_VANPL|nr:hypothetical protein HPP92_003047 [Vanilla planifolia]